MKKLLSSKSSRREFFQRTFQLKAIFEKLYKINNIKKETEKSALSQNILGTNNLKRHLIISLFFKKHIVTRL